MSWLDWLFTPVCPLCQRPTASGDGCFCRDCANLFHPHRQADWLPLNRLPHPAQQSSPPLKTTQDASDLLPAFGWSAYNGVVKRSLRSLKYERCPEVGETLGRWMGECWLANAPLQPSTSVVRQGQPPNRRPTRQQYLVVPIPLHASRRQERGFNQAEVIARAFCGVTGDRLRLRLLRRQQATQPQFGLSASERFTNVRQAFAADTCDRQKLPILLVDDIYTTGSTVAAAYQVLDAQGWQVAAALTVAAATMERSSA